MAIRIGILGAARIAPSALIEPARNNADVEVVAVAARDQKRAGAFAKKHGIGKVHASYDALLDDPNIDAIYNPLPNSLHGRWTIAAIEAGKHVLCEKPFAANAAEAEKVAGVAKRSGKVVMEAFHYRYHALTLRMLEIIASGELGPLKRVEASFCFPLPIDDIRWDWNLAGGSMMDAGCYPTHLVRTLAGAEPRVTRASAKLRSPNIDRLVVAELEFPGGATGSITASMLSSKFVRIGGRVLGSEGEMRVTNFLAPQYGHSLQVKVKGKRRKESVDKQPTSYAAQLKAFADAVLRGAPFPTTVDDAVANMRVIDAIYRACGLPKREPAKA